MDTQKQHDTRDSRETGPLRILGRLYREAADTGEPAGYPYQVVHPQEPLWVLDMRPIDALPYGLTQLRVVLRPKDGTGEWFWWPGHITFRT